MRVAARYAVQTATLLMFAFLEHEKRQSTIDKNGTFAL